MCPSPFQVKQYYLHSVKFLKQRPEAYLNRLFVKAFLLLSNLPVTIFIFFCYCNFRNSDLLILHLFHIFFKTTKLLFLIPVLGQANCTFEKGEDCFLENSTLDDFDWHRKSVSFHIYYIYCIQIYFCPVLFSPFFTCKHYVLNSPKQSCV